MVISILILVASAFSWWKMVYSSPTNVFNRMLANSLASPAVSKVVKQNDDSQNLNQKSALVTEPEQIVHAISVLGQTSDADQ